MRIGRLRRHDDDDADGDAGEFNADAAEGVGDSESTFGVDDNDTGDDAANGASTCS
jgi:hypothetical protein